jgi:periplasmic mercuric ion binding protein
MKAVFLQLPQTHKKMKNKTCFIIVSLLLIANVLIISSCSESVNTENFIDIKFTEKIVEGEESKTVALIGIDGMSCEIGCSKFIQHKLSSFEGVISAEVVFDENRAIVQFDGSKTNEKELVLFISKLNDGQYKVTEVEVEKTIKKAISSGSLDSGTLNSSSPESGESVSYQPSFRALLFPNIFNLLKQIVLPE